MHKKILSPEQVQLLRVVQLFSEGFGLVGGTAIALQIGHRESIDFDLFTFDEFENQKIRRKILRIAKIDTIIRDEKSQFTFLINGVRFTFFQFPYKIDFSESLDDVIKMPNILTLAAMKAFALGRRAKWKDYVDLYFILKAHHSVAQITAKGKELFGNEFNEKIFRVQLSYFTDIDYSEPVVYANGQSVPDATIQKTLREFSVE
jgi:hypothetical protein